MAKKVKLSRLKNTAKGPIHHIEIRPAKNAAGKRAFVTMIHREHPPAVQAAADKNGKFLPPPTPEETLHDDGNDMLDHVANSYGIQREPDEDDEGGEED